MWAEIGTEAREWRIPGERMKGRSGPSRAAERSGAGRTRTSPGAGPWERADLPVTAQSGASTVRLVTYQAVTGPRAGRRGLVDRATVHEFRSAFRDWCADTGLRERLRRPHWRTPSAVFEGAYFRSDLLERRRVLMEQWAAFTADGEGEAARGSSSAMRSRDGTSPSTGNAR